jgi:DNA-binding transcriptional LysR family regulator
MKSFGHRFPEIDLRLVEIDSSQQLEQIALHQLDIGLIGLGHTERTDDLELVPIVDQRLTAVFPEDHPQAGKKKAIALKSLAQERFLVAARSNADVFNSWLIVLCQQAGFHPQIAQEFGQPLTVLNYVAGGLGITILPAQYGSLQIARIRFRPLDRSTPPYRYCAAYHRSFSNPAIPLFMTAVPRVNHR